jgi:hypothetical protein
MSFLQPDAAAFAYQEETEEVARSSPTKPSPRALTPDAHATTARAGGG